MLLSNCIISGKEKSKKIKNSGILMASLKRIKSLTNFY